MLAALGVAQPPPDADSSRSSMSTTATLTRTAARPRRAPRRRRRPRRLRRRASGNEDAVRERRQRRPVQGHPERRRPEGRLAGAAQGRRASSTRRRTRSSGSQFTSGPPLLEALNAGADRPRRRRQHPAALRRRRQEQAQGRRPAPRMGAQGRRDRGARRTPRSRRSPTSRARRSRSPRAARPTTTCWPSWTRPGCPTTTSRSQNLQPADALAAFTAGHVDAWAIWDPYTSQAEVAGRAPGSSPTAAASSTA